MTVCVGVIISCHSVLHQSFHFYSRCCGIYIFSECTHYFLLFFVNPCCTSMDCITSIISYLTCRFISSAYSSRAASGSPMRSRSLSPHSPRHADPSSSSSSSSLEQRPLPIPGEGSRGSSRGVGGGRGEEAMTGEKQNALLKVSEAHLAILPDEDGDT